VEWQKEHVGLLSMAEAETRRGKPFDASRLKYVKVSNYLDIQGLQSALNNAPSIVCRG